MRRARAAQCGIALALLCAGVSCQQQQETAKLNGLYRGALHGTTGVAAVSVQLDETQGAVSGTGQATGLTFASGLTYYVVGAHTGEEVDLSIRAGFATESFAFGFIEGECNYVLSGHVSSSRLQGSYRTLGCPSDQGTDQGTFELQRQ